MKPRHYSRGSLIGTGKIVLFSFFITLFGFAGYSQTKEDSVPVNAYYLAKDLYSASKKIKSTDLTKDSISKIAKSTLAKVYYYTGTDESGELQKMIGTSIVLDTLLNQLQKAASFYPNSTKIEKILAAKKTDIKPITELIARDSINKKTLDTLNEIDKNLKLLIDKKVDILKLKKEDYSKIFPGKLERTTYFPKLGIVNDTIIQFNYKLLVSLIDSFTIEKNLINSQAIIFFDTLNEANRKKIGIDVKSNNIEPLVVEFRKQLENVQQQDAQITISLLESYSGSISGWKMPSEAEMIDAVATYIASRVKQETVLWFFEQMRNNAERYDLIMTAFPETMKLLQSSEVFDAPNMGSAWKYALSKDFVHLPKSVLSSKWVKDRVPKNQQKYLELPTIAWEISELVDNRHSYRDLIKELYLKRNLDEPKEVDNFSDSIINFLYAVSNELYVVNKTSIRNLTYEEISSMPFGQLEIMLELLNMKYTNSINNLFLDKPGDQISSNDKKQIAKWIGNSLLALSQFDKILQQVEQSRKGKDQKETVLFDGYNTWKLISQLVKASVPAKKEAVYKTYFDRADDAFEIYHLLSEKNYAGAVAKTLELIDTLIFNEYLVIDTVKYNINSSFLIPIDLKTNPSYHFDSSIIKKQLEEQGIKKGNVEKILEGANQTFCAQTYSSKVVRIGDKEYIKLEFNDLKSLLKDNKSKHEKQLNSISHKFDKNILDEIIKDYANWRGEVAKETNAIQFPINSMAAQVLMSSDKKSMQMIMKLGSFLNDVAISDNEKELKKVIESYALPPGSYKQKRNAWHSITLNAFAGPYFGYETSSILGAKTKSDSVRSFGWNYGISAPIGITYTKTFGKKLDRNSESTYAFRNNPDLIRIRNKELQTRSKFSMSVTLSLVDIGAVVSYRMSNTTEVLDQSFKWEQFVSPGLHLGFAIPKTPLTVQMGYQYTPKVRRVYEEPANPNDPNEIRKDTQIGMWRSYVGVFFDIPLVNLWMQTRSVKFE